MCLAMALAGFLSFGSKTDGNVLNNFPSDNVMVNIARLWVLFPALRPLTWADPRQLLRFEHAHDPTVGGLCVPFCDDNISLPRRTFQSEPPFNIYHFIGCDSHGYGFDYLWPWCRVWAHRSNECLCIGIHSPTSLLHQAKPYQLESENPSLCLHSFRDGGHGFQPSPGSCEDD